MRKFCLQFEMAGLALVLAVMVGCAKEPVSVEPEATAVPAKAEAGGLSIVYDESKGRFVSLEADGESFFWMNPNPVADPRTGWVDWGGDKVWVLPQGSWRRHLGRVWPPGSDLEGLPWKRENLDEAGKGAASTSVPAAGVGVMRLWGLGKENGSVSVYSKMWRQAGGKEAPAHLWGVAQVKAGEFGMIGLAELTGSLGEVMWFGNGKQGCRVVNDKSGRARALVVRPGGAGGKVGTMGTWVAAVYPRHVLVREILHPIVTAHGEAGRYADRSSVQLFQGLEFWELETLGPVMEGADRQTTLIEQWWLLDRPAGMSEEALALWVDKEMRKVIVCRRSAE